MTAEIYGALGISAVDVGVSTRPEGEFAGDRADWDIAEETLIAAVRGAGYDCRIKPGDAAFYGPKVEFDFDVFRTALLDDFFRCFNFLLSDPFSLVHLNRKVLDLNFVEVEKRLFFHAHLC